jgi:predicted kinase
MLYIIRGLPGSGKSTLAHKMGVVHFEPDMFAMHHGKYQFDPRKLNDAIIWSTNSVIMNLEKGLDVAAVGTLTKKFHFHCYIEYCEVHNIPYKVIRCMNDYGNIHNVPEDVIKRMTEEMEDFPGEILYKGDYEKLSKELWG